MSTRSRFVLPLALMSVCFLASTAQAGVHFTDITSQAGTIMAHDPDGASLQNWYGPGVAWVDVNHDGWLDLFATNGPAGCKLFLNNADGTFTDVPGAMGMTGAASGNGVAAADIDNDGDVDIAVGNLFAEPYMYVHGGSGFNDEAGQMKISPVYGILDPMTMGVTYGDINLDGYLDLYVANYRQQADVFYRNLGGLFQRTEAVSATADGYGFMSVFFDFDNDGDPDIYVANDFGFNYLFVNQGPASGYALEEHAADYKITGGGRYPDGSPGEQSMSMGLAVADFDNDLDQDVYVTNYRRNAFYENKVNETGRFKEISDAAGVAFDLNCWGVDFCDLDLDGDLDLIQASGYIYAPIPEFDQPLELPNKVWLNNLKQTGYKNFTDVSDAAGFNDTGMGRGLATGDFDRDGDVDVAITNNSMDHPDTGVHYTGHLMLFRNDQDLDNHWVNVRLVGGGPHASGLGCNRSAVGAKVFLRTATTTQMREVQAGASFMSHNSIELEFGIGAENAVTDVEVHWPCGAVEHFTGVYPGEFWVLEEGAGAARTVPVAFASFSATAEREGVRLEWLTGVTQSPIRTRVYRAPADRPDLLHPIDVEVDYHDGQGMAFDDGVSRGESYAYQVTLEGSGSEVIYSPVATVKMSGDVPGYARASVGQNYPNPFNPSTTIKFNLPRRANFSLRIYDQRGRLVRDLYSGELEAGEHEVDWNGKDDQGRAVASGTYSYVLVTPDATSSRSMTLVQ